MCGRYYMDDGAAAEIEELLEEMNRELSGGSGGSLAGSLGGSRSRAVITAGDICPSCHATVLTKASSGIAADIKRWGFPGWDGKGLVINARAETVMEKKMFRESVRCRRCVVPASGFYEWNREKEKFTFFLPGERMMFLAGIYRRFQEDEEDRYTILTTRANASMKLIHPRMPLILRREEAKRWLEDGDAVKWLLELEPEELGRKAEYEQMKLPFLEGSHPGA